MKETQRITITLPQKLYQKIKEQAERDTRTIGEEITHLLKLHVPGYADATDTTNTTADDDIMIPLIKRNII
jgi:metal-responsive CopG/Arc/MetJ family transcriptional regulator